MYEKSFREAEAEWRQEAPFLDMAMQKPVTGYEFRFQRQLDYRTSAKSNK
jgi:hypothetical protein